MEPLPFTQWKTPRIWTVKDPQNTDLSDGDRIVFSDVEGSESLIELTSVRDTQDSEKESEWKVKWQGAVPSNRVMGLVSSKPFEIVSEAIPGTEKTRLKANGLTIEPGVSGGACWTAEDG